MLTETTVTKLQEMHLSTMAKAFKEQMTDPAMSELSFEDRFGLIVDQEWTNRKNNHLKRLIQKAGFAESGACVEDIDYSGDRNLDKAQITRLATCNYLIEHNNILLLGATGSGKTYLACALGMAAVRNFFSVKYVRLPELLTDLAFHATFPQAEIEKEVEVILDEIESYNDSPSELIFDEFEHLLFARHPLGRMILGDKRALQTFTSESGRSFTRRFYAPRNMLFFSMGRNNFEQIVQMGEKLLADTDFPMAERKRKRPKQLEAKEVHKHKDTHQAHVLIGGQAYDLFDPERVPLYLLNNLLGGPGMNSLLNVLLRERNGLVYNVEGNVSHYTDAGMATIYFGCAPKNKDKAIELVRQQLAEMRQQPLSASRLSQAKKQAIGQIGVASDNRENLFLGFGKSLLHYDRYDSMEQVVARIQQSTAYDIQRVANEVYAPERLSTLIYD